jgi:hypothetical protein
MNRLTDFPLLVFAISLVWLYLWAQIGAALGRRRPLDAVGARGDFDVVRAATLTLLGLIIGFSFSMAISRYDLRKNYEEAEANAIGTEYVRAGLLPAADGTTVRTLLRKYLDQRVLFYTTRDTQQLRQINADTAKLQADLWAALQGPAATTPNPVVALALAGMNDVLNSQGYTQAAWWNRIPRAAWGLMVTIATWSSVLIGYGTRSNIREPILLLVLPLVVSISLFFIADLDSPRGGVILVSPQNLVSLIESLGAQ